MKRIAIVGGSGAIGRAFCHQLSERYPNAEIFVFSRRGFDQNAPNIQSHTLDFQDETALGDAADLAAGDDALDMVFVPLGMLHDEAIMPEKSLRDLSSEKFHRLFDVNCVLPAMIAKYFTPKLNRKNPSYFAALSARVGSISDNHLGGWYAYRASKAALNMVIKNTAIEVGRRNKSAIIVGLHPGTVDSGLSQPFQGNVPEGKLFTPEFSAKSMLSVLEGLTPNESGRCFAWDGQEITP